MSIFDIKFSPWESKEWVPPGHVKTVVKFEYKRSVTPLGVHHVEVTKWSKNTKIQVIRTDYLDNDFYGDADYIVVSENKYSNKEYEENEQRIVQYLINDAERIHNEH